MEYGNVRFGYGGVQELLGALHSVAAGKAAAFAARLKHLQRLGFPPEVNTGKGTRAAYSLKAVLQMVTAIELIQFGISPGKVVDVLTHSWDACEHAWIFGIQEAVLVGRADDHQLLMFSPEALKELTEGGVGKYDGFAAIEVARASALPALLSRDDEGLITGERYRLAVLDVTDLARAVVELLNQLELITNPSELVAETDRWMEEHEARVQDLLKSIGELDRGDNP